jgi:DNA-binding NtrC family response regulator
MATRNRILLLSQDTQLEDSLRVALDRERGVALEAPGTQALAALLRRGAALVIMDLALPAAELQLAAAALNAQRDVPVLLATPGGRNAAQQSVARWRDLGPVPALEQVLVRHADPAQLRAQVMQLVERGQYLQGNDLIGRSGAMRNLREQVLRVAATPVSTILLLGETGAGKDLVAHALHKYSDRAEAPFIPINCAAIPENLLESELFGHERGAFTDAKSQRHGLFEQAAGGTVFLDEIGEMSLSAQIRLLRVLEQREVTRVGGSNAIAVDIRIIAATNRDLHEAVGQGEFRLDLYHRLKVVSLEIPPLRQRPDDIPLLIEHFVKQFASAGGEPFRGFTQAAMNLLVDYEWPGNVRELRNLVEHLAFLGPRRSIEPQDLVPHLEGPPVMQRHLPVPTSKTPDQSERELIYFALLDLKREVAEVRRLVEEQGLHPAASPAAVYQLEPPVVSPPTSRPAPEQAVEALRSLKELEEEAIEQALARVGGNRKQAAGILGISPRTLYRKLDEYGLR